MSEPHPLPEGMIQIVMALGQDAHLRHWFESLALETPNVRATEFRTTAARIVQEDSHNDLRHALGLLAAPGMYEAVLETLDILEPQENQ